MLLGKIILFGTSKICKVFISMTHWFPTCFSAMQYVNNSLTVPRSSRIHSTVAILSMLTTDFTDPDLLNIPLPDSLNKAKSAFVILLLHPLFSAEVLRFRITIIWLVDYGFCCLNVGIAHKNTQLGRKLSLYNTIIFLSNKEYINC